MFSLAMRRPRLHQRPQPRKWQKMLNERSEFSMKAIPAQAGTQLCMGKL
jgi:hypothetical protein